MIINFGNEVKTNLEDNKVQLDINDTDYLLSLITTRLYSDPIGSFLREIVSNAVDSHKEAGNTDPVLIEVGYHKLTSKYYFRIQDYGTGISTEKFNEIYRKAGKSTRRDTNLFLGGYGVGRFSSLSVADNVYLRSVINNTEYLYIMYKNGLSINIDLITENYSTDKNGFQVELQFNTRTELNNIVDNIYSNLCLFENLYIIEKDGYSHYDIATFNSLKIKKFDNFIYVGESSLCIRKLKIAIGNTVYNINTSHFKHSELFDSPLFLKFEIGELNVTPNKEEIIYDEKCVKKIQSKLDDTIKELIALQQKYIDEYPVNCFFDLHTLFFKINYLNLIDNSEIAFKFREFLNFKYKDKIYTYKELKVVFDNDLNFQEIVNVKRYKSQNGLSAPLHKKLGLTSSLKNKYILEDNIKRVTRAYIACNHPSGTHYLSRININNYRKIVQELSYLKNRYIDTTLIRYFIKEFINEVKSLPVVNDSIVPLDFIKTNKKAKVKIDRDNTQFLVKAVVKSYRNDTGYTTENCYSRETTLHKHILIVYTDKLNDEVGEVFKAVTSLNKNVYFYIVAKSNFKYFQNKSNCKSFEEFYSPKTKMIRTIATLSKYYDEIHNISLLRKKSVDFGSNLRKIIKDADSFIEKIFPSNSCYYYDFRKSNKILELCKTQKYYDFALEAELKENINKFKKVYFLLDFKHNISIQQSPVLEFYIKKNKLYKL